MLRSFPGAEVVIEPRIGGQMVKFDAWKYHLEISLTTHRVKLVDVPGEMTMQFMLRPEKWPQTLLGQETTTDLAKAKEFVINAQEYLAGIAASIMMVLEEPAEKPPANIFL